MLVVDGLNATSKQPLDTHNTHTTICLHRGELTPSTSIVLSPEECRRHPSFYYKGSVERDRTRVKPTAHLEKQIDTTQENTTREQNTPKNGNLYGCGVCPYIQ